MSLLEIHKEPFRKMELLNDVLAGERQLLPSAVDLCPPLIYCRERCNYRVRYDFFI